MGSAVVAIEANGALIEQGRQRFASALIDGQLVLLHQALAAEQLAGTRPPQATPAAAVAPEASSTAPDQPVQTADAPTGEISR